MRISLPLMIIALFCASNAYSQGNTLSPTGNVLIATTDVTGQKLQVNGLIDLTGNTSARAVRLYDGTNFTGGFGNALWAFGTSSSDLALYTPANLIFGANGYERFRLSSSGYVGIGTSSPGYPLDVAGSIRSSAPFLSTVGSGASFIHQTSGTENFEFGYDSPSGIGGGSYLYTTNGGKYLYHENSSGHLLLMPGGSGNVGIGTTSSPAQKLDVSGAIQISGGAGLVLANSVNSYRGLGLSIII